MLEKPFRDRARPTMHRLRPRWLCRCGKKARWVFVAGGVQQFYCCRACGDWAAQFDPPRPQTEIRNLLLLALRKLDRLASQLKNFT